MVVVQEVVGMVVVVVVVVVVLVVVVVVVVMVVGYWLWRSGSGNGDKGGRCNSCRSAMVVVAGSSFSQVR